MAGIKKKFVSGVMWESFGRFSSLGIQFLVTVIISRVLTPSEFGVIGLLTIFIALGTILLDSGFSQALIQKRDVSQLEYSSVFYTNLLLGIFLYLVLYASSTYIADFYDLPELSKYAKVLFLIIPFNSFGLVQNVIIQKELKFKKTATANLMSAIFSGIVGVFMAYQGAGVWALVYQQIALHASKTVLYILQNKWLPSFIYSLQPIKSMFGFSINLMFHSMINTTMRNVHALFIGKFFPIAQVGYYNQANKFEEISASTLSQIIIKVSFPALVQKKDNPELLRQAYSKIFSTTIFLIAPLMFFLMVIGEPLFRLLLTAKWLPAVPYFQILCIYGMLLPVLQISYNIYKLYRQGRMLLSIDIARHVLIILSIVFTINLGVEYMLYGLSLTTIIMVVLNLFFSGKLVSISLVQQLKSLLPYYLIAGVTALGIYNLPSFSSDFLTIISSGILFVLVYFSLTWLLKLEGFKDFIDIFKSLSNKVARQSNKA